MTKHTLTVFGFSFIAIRKMSDLSQQGYSAEVISFVNDKGKRGQIDMKGRVTWYNGKDDDVSDT